MRTGALNGEQVPTPAAKVCPGSRRPETYLGKSHGEQARKINPSYHPWQGIQWMIPV